MREKQQKQMPLMEPVTDHPQAKELEAISIIIDNTPNICVHVLQDLKGAGAQPGAYLQQGRS